MFNFFSENKLISSNQVILALISCYLSSLDIWICGIYEYNVGLEGLTTNVKLFADDSSLFSFVHDTQTSANDLNKDLKLINNWAFQWKMNFNPDPTKQVREFIFSRKAKEKNHPPLVFNNTSVSQSSSHKHLGVILDSKLIFDEHLKMVSFKISKTLGLVRKLHNLLPRSALITIYKAFVRPYLGYGNVLYDQAYNMS